MSHLNQQHLPLTERQNELTLSIDLSTNFFQDFMHVDQQLFSGYKNFRSVYAFEKEMKQLVELIRRGKLAMSGCGTSGRIAWLCARGWNQFLRECEAKGLSCGMQSGSFSYLIAGGDTALIRAEEVCEDDVNASVPSEIQSLVGISCGLSAPYVAGQCRNMIETDREAVILGFNPLELARDRLIFQDESPIRTFRDFLHHYTDRLLILNPVVGAEAITGSTRMKGGSATKFLLDAAFIAAYDANASLYDILHQFETTFRYTYNPAYFEKVNHFIDIYGDSLSRNGHIYYVGYDTAGLLSIIDASECVPTFGAVFEDIRGFVVDGWKAMQNNDGDLTSRGDNFTIDASHFEDSILPQVTSRDSVVFLYIDAYDESIRTAVSQRFDRIRQKLKSLPSSPAVMSLLVTDSKDESYNVFDSCSECKGEKDPYSLVVRIPRLCPENMTGFSTYGELSMKFLLNAISTGAHIVKGTVFTNQMINVRVSNNKLFYRAIGIVSKIAEVEESVARHCLLRAIYERDGGEIPTDSDDNSIVEGHIRASVKHSHNVPVAILLAHGFSMEKALKTLQDNPRIRKVILALKESTL